MSTTSPLVATSFNLNLATRLLLCAGAFTLACSAETPDDDAEDLALAPVDELAPELTADEDPASEDGEVVATRVDLRDGRSFTRTKVRAADGTITGVVRDEHGRAVDLDDLAPFTHEPIAPELARMFAGQPADARVDVVVVLRSDIEETSGRAGSVAVDLDARGGAEFAVDGVRATAGDVARLQDNMFAGLSRQADLRIARRRAALDTLTQRHGWQRDEALMAAQREPQGWLARSLTRAEVEAIVDRSADLVERIDLAYKTDPSIAGGLASIGVDAWAHNYGIRGAGVGIFMSEAYGKCPVSPYVNSLRYTNLQGGAENSHADLVGEVLKLTAPDSHIYCGDTMIGNPNAYSPAIRVTNHSWRLSEESNTYSYVDRDFDDAVYNNRLAVFVAAGNVDDATQTWNVGSPGRGFNSLTVGNYDHTTNQMNPRSRHINPNTGAEKPEISAPGTNIPTSVGTATGTSISSPYSAGFAADLMSQHTWLQGHPELIKAMMMAGATRNIEGAAALSAIDGAGGLSYLNTGYNGSLQWWSGGNASTFDAANNVTRIQYLVAGQRYRMALAWVVPGSYAYSNANVNMDLDMWVTAPNGSWVAGSYSYDNGFEIVDFVAPTTGNYTVTINRFWNSGVGDVIMGHHTQLVW